MVVNPKPGEEAIDRLLESMQLSEEEKRQMEIDEKFMPVVVAFMAGSLAFGLWTWINV